MHKQEEESYSGSMVIKFEAFYLIWIKFARILKNERLHYHTKNVLFLGGYNLQGHILETKKMRKHVIFFI